MYKTVDIEDYVDVTLEFDNDTIKSILVEVKRDNRLTKEELETLKTLLDKVKGLQTKVYGYLRNLELDTDCLNND